MKLMCTLPLLSISGFVLNEKFQRNTSKFAIFYIGIRKPKVAFSVFHFVLFYFFPSWVPRSMSTLTRAFIREKNKVALNEKLKKQLWVFVYLYKIWQILKRFAGTFCRAQTWNWEEWFANCNQQRIEIKWATLKWIVFVQIRLLFAAPLLIQM